MRNLKRVLALALALVMMLGMMITASAASYTDAAAIDEDYAVAVEVLTGMGVFKGQSTASAVFAPKAVLTRAEAATLIYRVITGDVTDKQVDLYDYAAFTDTAEGAWYTGYVTYAANGGYIKGYAGNFMPNDQVTGIQVMAIMLRAAGYGQNGEYEGAAWKDNILTDAKELGITGSIATNDLDKPATRELVAQLIFNAITNVKMVSYAPLLGYYKAADAETLAEKVFDLASVETEDDWGRPITVWYNAKKGTAKGTYATIAVEPVATYTVAVSDCDIAKDLGLKKSQDVVVYENGVKGSTYITLTKQAKENGAQGTLIEVYDEEHIVVIDTYLAQITKITDEKTDKNGHVTVPASVSLDVWYDSSVADKAVVEGTTEYAKDTYVLVYVNEAEEYVEIVAEADSFVGAQSKIWYNASKRTIEGDDYNEAVNYLKDDAGYDDAKYTWFVDLYGNVIGSAEIAASYNYAVLKDMIWNVGRPGSAEATLVYMDGTEETVTVDKIDGGDEYFWDTDNHTVKLDDDVNVPFGDVSSDSKYNGQYEGIALYKIEYNKNGSVNLHGIVNGDTVVFYSDEAVIDTSSSVILDDDNFGKLFVTTKTEFLVREGNARTGYTYEVYDIDSLPEFAADAAEIFYTIGKNGLVDRVYIKNAALEADFGTHLFTITNSCYRVAGSYEDWTMTVLIDGVEREIVTDYDNMQILKANKGKLFHVEWIDNPYTDLYGYVNEIRLINDAEEDGANFWGCNYLAGDTTVTVSSIINGGASYRFDANTVVYGDIDSIDELTQAVANEKGIWVLADPTTSYSRAKVIYVGTKLSESTRAEVTYGTPAVEATPNATFTVWTVNVPYGTKSAVVTVAPEHFNAVVDEDGYFDYIWTGTVEVGTPVELTIIAEDAYNYKNIKIEVVEAQPVYAWEVVNTTMDSAAGPEIEIAMTKNGDEVAMADVSNLTVGIVVYAEDGTVVFTTDNAAVAQTEDGHMIVTAEHTLTAGAKYKAVVTISGSLTIPGVNSVETVYVQAQTTV